MAKRYFKETSIKLNLERYSTSYLIKKFKVTRQTIAIWRQLNAIPANYTMQVIELLRHND